MNDAEAPSVREQMLAIIQEQPGINKLGLSRALGIAWGTVGYHIHRLQKDDLVRGIRQGRELVLFRTTVPSRHHASLTALRHPEAWNVVESLDAEQGVGLNELSHELGRSRKVVKRFLLRLVDAGVVERTSGHRGRYTLCRDELRDLPRGNP